MFVFSSAEIPLAIKQEQQQRSYSLDQNGMEAFYIKKEPEKHGSILEGECLEDYPSILTGTNIFFIEIWTNCGQV